jgi:hypothetical protein
MEKVKYNIAIQTFMEVFDYLLNNNMLEFDAGEDFLRSRITIGPYGFMLETQVARGKWDEEHPNAKLIPAIYVLNYLANNIDEVLRKRNVPVSPSSDYAYINDAQAKLTGYKTYYPSYKELIKKLKEVRNSKETYECTDGRVLDFNVTKLRELSQVFARLTPLEIRTVECYARLEEELINLTAYLLLRDKDNFAVDYPNKEMYDDPDYHLAPTDTSVDWEEFKEYITSEFEFQKEEGKFDLRGAYSTWDENPYISPLGLDGLTK